MAALEPKGIQQPTISIPYQGHALSYLQLGPYTIRISITASKLPKVPKSEFLLVAVTDSDGEAAGRPMAYVGQSMQKNSSKEKQPKPPKSKEEQMREQQEQYLRRNCNYYAVLASEPVFDESAECKDVLPEDVVSELQGVLNGYGRSLQVPAGEQTAKADCTEVIT
ncbi:hypothetical protein HDU96_010123, partial [Phlyctochytrium bullatum]